MTETRQLIRRFADDVHGDGRIELIDELCHEDFVNHTAPEALPPGREGEKTMVRMVHDAISDREATTERIVVNGNQAAWRWSAKGTHTGEFLGIAPSGNQIEVAGNDIAVVRDGKIAEVWDEFDMLDLMVQMGAIEPPMG